ncbi:LamG domain-containing protein, partial [Patescibacteria group bacterium]|nr:LamG domain-containing protein [Patescibacteria group bacterium]
MKVFKHLKETFKHNIKSLYKKSFSFNNRKRILHRRYRKISFIVIALLVIVNMTIFTFSALSQNVVSFGTVQGSTLNKGLVGHWSMDAVEYNSSTNRVTDKTPYSSHGTNYGATFTTDRNGKTDGAMSFDGSNDYIDCGNSIFRNHDTFTVGLWFNRYSDLASYTNHGVYNMLLAKASGAYNDNFELGTNGNNIQLYLDTSISNETRSFPAGILNNEFYYLAVTFDNGLAKIYVNGEFIDSSDWSGTLDSNADLSVFAIGESQHAGAPFNGLIDDVRIYNRVLSESEIQSLYDSYEPKISAGSLNKGLVLDMPLTLKYTKDETAGSEIMTDKTPYSNDGQNNGATITAEGASFDGVDDFIDINSFNYPSSWKQPFSLSSWVYIPSSYSWNTSRMSNIIGRGYYTGSLGLVMGTSDNTIRGWVRGDNGSTSASGSITRDNWHHASMIWDGSIVSLY